MALRYTKCCPTAKNEEMGEVSMINISVESVAIYSQFGQLWSPMQHEWTPFIGSLARL